MGSFGNGVCSLYIDMAALTTEEIFLIFPLKSYSFVYGKSVVLWVELYG